MRTSGVWLRDGNVGGRHGGHRQAGARRLAGQIELQPSRQRRGQRRDDDLIEAPRVDAVVDGHDGIGVADDSLDIGPGGLAQQGQGLLDHGAGFARALILGVDDPMQAMGRVRDEQRERGRSTLGALPHRVQQRLSGGRLMRHDQHSNGGLGVLHVRTPFSVIACDDRTLWLMPQDAAFTAPYPPRRAV